MVEYEFPAPPPKRYVFKTTSKKPTVRPRIAAGASIGCFAGVGYGLAVGVGRMRSVGRNTAVVTPSLSPAPFAHDGAIMGAFCGVMVGAGFASAIAFHIGYEWKVFQKRAADHAELMRRRTVRCMQVLGCWLQQRRNILERRAIDIASTRAEKPPDGRTPEPSHMEHGTKRRITHKGHGKIRVNLSANDCSTIRTHAYTLTVTQSAANNSETGATWTSSSRSSAYKQTFSLSSNGQGASQFCDHNTTQGTRNNRARQNAYAEGAGRSDGLLDTLLVSRFLIQGYDGTLVPSRRDVVVGNFQIAALRATRSRGSGMRATRHACTHLRSVHVYVWPCFARCAPALDAPALDRGPRIGDQFVSNRHTR
ncbi:hypothetical protein FGB62_44g126 [Gracilaria domingensis]|nr:hypothetical protein FGB62_44g126 [Gracilaria domingensis]